MGVYTEPRTLQEKLGGSFDAFMDLIRFVRVNYVMDELWNGEDELKFRRSGKTLVTVCIKDGGFSSLIIFGQKERDAFDTARDRFSDFIRGYYDSSHTYHDGKWMFIDIRDGAYMDEIIGLLTIKKKPNRKIDTSKAEYGQCGNRCDQCLLYVKNNESTRGNLEFHEKDWICYHSENEERADYTNMTCVGCTAKPHDACPEKICLQQKGYANCLQCGEYSKCKINSHNFDPAGCNLGISADDVTRAVIPYYCNFWLDIQKNTVSH